MKPFKLVFNKLLTFLFNFQGELDIPEDIPQNVKKLRLENSDDEMSPQKKAGQQQKIDITDPAYRVPFTYGWKRELVR